MNFKNIMTKAKDFITNFKSPIIVTGCILVAVAVILAVILSNGALKDVELSTADEELSITEEAVVEEDSSVTVEETVTLSVPVTPDDVIETTTKKAAATTYITTDPTTKETTTTITTTTSNNSESEDWLNGYTWREYDLLARTIYQESGICGEYCQWLVGSTVLNRADRYGGIESVVFNPSHFDVYNVLFRDTPSDLSYSVARRLISGDRDYNVMAFRDSYYHNFGTPYTSVDNMYFSVF